MGAALAACLVLWTGIVLRQASPQRIEQVTEVRWCSEGGRHELVRVEGWRVDGRPAGAERQEVIWVVREQRPAEAWESQ